MRRTLSNALIGISGRNDFVFLTGDLGFMALEPLREKSGGRFLNAGLSEQNMVGVAAGLAAEGFQPWIYSIAPFLYARPLEQIRNDVCFHDLPVRLVGNGGGYAYGVMGATHHALEDYGVLLSLPNMKVYVPAFAADLVPMVQKLVGSPHPAYLRLGRDEKPADFSPPDYSPWRKIAGGKGPTVVVVGPLVGTYLSALAESGGRSHPNLWVLSELPVTGPSLPAELLKDLGASDRLIVAEEHVSHGSAGEALSRVLLEMGAAPKNLTHLHARGYPSGLYGSQDFHRKESGLSAGNFLKALETA